MSLVKQLSKRLVRSVDLSCRGHFPEQLERPVDYQVELEVEVFFTVEHLLGVQTDKTALLDDRADGLEAEFDQQSVLLVQMTQRE